MKKIIEENEKIAVNTKEIEILKKHFPNCFNKDGEFQMDKFEKRISQEVDVTKEGYELRWLGKNYARLLANVETETMIVDDKEHNDKVENKNSENIYIEGDNIDVLKHLKNAYSEKIKMIYIDPPYNTGSDGFVYKDDRKYTKEDLAELTNITEEEAQRILSFNTKGSNSHSAWLTFMYPRLLTARELLSDDGVIFISIDDNEVSQLKLLCDEVFGEENFVEFFSWTKTSTPPALSNKVRKTNEYILCYEKNKNSYKYFGEEVDGGDQPLLNNGNKEGCLNIPKEKIRFNLEDGIYQAGTYHRIKLLETIEIKDNVSNKDLLIEGKFKWQQSFLDSEIEKGTTFIIKSNKFSVRFQRFEDESYKAPTNYFKDKIISPILDKENKNIDTNETASSQLEELFGIKIFDFSKPISLIKYLINMVSKTDPNPLILDFFSGSATTAHAVMQLNAEDGGNRKFIMVQIPEEIDPKKSKAAYDFCVDELKQEPVITTIGKERIKRAANKIKKENESKLEEKPLDLGFKLFKTKSIPEKYIERMKDENNELLVTKMLSKEELQALLITWKTYDGYPLTKELKTVQFGKYNSYVVDRILYLVNTDFNLENLLEFIKKLDSDGNFVINKIVIFGYHFNSDILLTIKDMVTTYRNKKSIELDVEVRY
jgi:adenine specific DNA methylase Mod